MFWGWWWSWQTFILSEKEEEGSGVDSKVSRRWSWWWRRCQALILEWYCWDNDDTAEDTTSQQWMFSRYNHFKLVSFNWYIGFILSYLLHCHLIWTDILFRWHCTKKPSYVSEFSYYSCGHLQTTDDGQTFLLLESDEKESGEDLEVPGWWSWRWRRCWQ
jgi:hypothetical protein